jgi:hypothetical protein
MGTVKTVNLKDFSKELKGFNEKSLKEKKQATVKGIVKSIPDLVAASPVDTGLYAASWDFTVEEEAVILVNYAPYAGIIENGTRPFTPPIAPLLAWAKRVLKSGSQPPDYEPKVWALAKGTQNKIAQYGMKPQHIMENAIPKIIDNIKAEFKKIE